jgi:hypothetical protein
MPCEGDKVLGQNTEAQCYRVDACMGCEKCIIPCSGCENCTFEQKKRELEVGDYVVVASSLITDPYWTEKWTPVMDMAIGRVGYIEEMAVGKGYRVRFKTTKGDTLTEFWFPRGSIRLAMPDDNKTDKLIKTVKKGNEEI